MDIDDFLDKFNWIERVAGFLWSFTAWLPRRRSHKGRKVGPWRLDPGVCQIDTDRHAHSGLEVELMLRRAHIPIEGCRVTGNGAHFLVRQRQYKWALYILLRAGVVVLSPVPADVARWAGKYTEPVNLWDGRRPDETAADLAKRRGPVQRQRPRARGTMRRIADSTRRPWQGLGDLFGR